MARRKRKKASEQRAETYDHKEAENVMRPEVGVQAQFKKKKPPQTYRYDSSLSPVLDWDDNPAREQGEALIARIEKATEKLSDAADPATIQNLQSEIQSATQELKALSRPFLDWAGKAERFSFDVPTLPLFIHERLSTKAILDTLKSHKRDKQLEIFGDPQHSIADQCLKAYEHRDQWVNRMILGDSLVVMNSLLHYEQLGGQVQMIYIDPPTALSSAPTFSSSAARLSYWAWTF